MNNKLKNSNNAGSWIGVCTAIGAALGSRKPKSEKDSE